MIDFGHQVKLTTIERHQLELLRSWRNNYEVWQYCRQNDLISEVAQEWWFQKQDQEPSIKMYLVVDESLRPIGVAGLTSIDYLNSRAEFSLYIAPPHRGKGLGEKALKTLVSHGMNNLGLRSIWGESFDQNPAIKLFQKIGFHYDGTRREAYFRQGKFIDAHLYSILRSEWKLNKNFNKEQKACSK